MMTRIATTLLCTVAPVALLAQEVTLESPDQFISVDGEIVGFNGVMVRVSSVVGTLSVPASEVICYGEGCLTTIANNDFGLTAAAFIDVIANPETDEAAPAAAVEVASNLQVGFAAPEFGAAFNTVVSAYASSGASDGTVAIGGNGDVTIGDAGSDAIVTIAPTNDLSTADVAVGAVALSGTAPQVFAATGAWATADALPYQLIGLRSFSVVVAPTAGVDSITMNDLARIYAGEITNWSQIGGADVSVLPLQLPSSSPLRAEVEALVMDPSGKQIAGNVLTMADEVGITASISQFPGSISIVNTEIANPDLTVPVAGSCGIPVEATTFNIVSGDYPLVRPTMVNFGTTSGGALVADMLDFASTDAVQALIADAGFIDYSAVQQDSTIKNARLGGLLGATLDDAQRTAAAEMFQILFDADRMSPTMTGGPASGPEGGWNRAMMETVISAMSDPANAGREVIFVGKGKSTSGSAAAVSASAAAAQAMQTALTAAAQDVVAAGGFTLSSYGFGDVAEVACIDGQVAGSDYTRVEVWMR